MWAERPIKSETPSDQWKSTKATGNAALQLQWSCYTWDHADMMIIWEDDASCGPVGCLVTGSDMLAMSHFRQRVDFLEHEEVKMNRKSWFWQEISSTELLSRPTEHWTMLWRRSGFPLNFKLIFCPTVNCHCRTSSLALTTIYKVFLMTTKFNLNLNVLITKFCSRRNCNWEKKPISSGMLNSLGQPCCLFTKINTKPSV